MKITMTDLMAMIRFHQKNRLENFKRYTNKKLINKFTYKRSLKETQEITEKLLVIEANIRNQTFNEMDDLALYLTQHPKINLPQLKKVVKRRLNSTFTIFN